MGLFGSSPLRPIVVKTYGRGSFLGLLSPLLAVFMSSRGLNGWQQSATRAMQDDGLVMARRGYHVVSAEEHTVPLFGIGYFKVTYALDNVR